MTGKRRTGVQEAPPAPYQVDRGVRFTLDTNVLVYAVDPGAGRRHLLANDLIHRAAVASCVLTSQSVREFFAIATRKDMAHRAAVSRRAHDLMDAFVVVPDTESAMRAAIDAAISGIASIWDALLIATAVEAGCSVVVSEDMSAGMHPLGARIVRPFAGDRLTAEVEALLA